MDVFPLTEQLIQRYGGAAPRYTSYPSAAHFQPGFSLPWTGRLSGVTSVSVYLHIPFCRALCTYCGCFTRIVRGDNPIREYLALLEKEIALAGSMAGRRIPAGHVHFGGGSPNLLSGREIGRLLDLIERNFGISEGAEIAMEADPRQMTAAGAGDYAAAGINRISLGVQDFNENTQKAINRIQPLAQIASCVRWLRRAGIGKINFDLIYGLPFQTAETVAENAFKAAVLDPDRLALFGYAHVPWLKTHQKALEKYSLPGPRERHEQAEAARAVLLEEGYAAIGMDHFARPGDTLARAAEEGTLRRNFQGYTIDPSPAVAGFGLSAISRCPDAYMQNTSSFKTYRERLGQNRLPVEKGIALSAEDRLRAAVIERLMCCLPADLGHICRLHGFAPDFLDGCLRKAAAMEQDGLIAAVGRVVTVTERGRRFVRPVCACFDSYFDTTGEKYARAV
jgi:oxygen-independent coproporphyrinogen-3 oxidase